jgi:hypothetical protein
MLLVDLQFMNADFAAVIKSVKDAGLTSMELQHESWWEVSQYFQHLRVATYREKVLSIKYSLILSTTSICCILQPYK